MNPTLRRGTVEDAAACGRICYEAFKAIATEHNFPPDFPSPDVGAGLLSQLLANPGFYSLVAELNGKVIGSNFLDERDAISGLGPITVDPKEQNHGIGQHYIIHSAPLREAQSKHYHWHMEITPALTKVAGFEIGTGFYINPVPPENAAEALREALALSESEPAPRVAQAS
jgi:predicted N-acetyltransferase YhbS